MWCNYCVWWKNIINDNGCNVCKKCGCVINYDLIFNISIFENVKKIQYKRLWYLFYLINIFNLKYIQYSDTIQEIYENIKDDLKFNYWYNKKYLKKNRIKIPYMYIFYFMKLKYKSDYLFIHYNNRLKIINLFLKYERIYNNVKSNINIKKKFLNYSFI